MPAGRHSDFSISLQRRDARVPGCAKKCAFLLRPHEYIDHTEFSDRITRKRKDPRPDLWLVQEDCSQSILIEVKLWCGEGRSQASDYAKQFKATALKEITFENLYRWLCEQKSSENDLDFLRKSLIAYLEDFGVTSSDRFSTRYFSVGSDGSFDEPILLKRHLNSLSSLLVKNLKDICIGSHVGNVSSDLERVYVDFGPKSKGSLAYPALGFHSDGLYPCIFISGLRSKWNGEFSGKKGMDVFLKRTLELRVGTGFEKVLNKLPVGTELILKAYRQRVKYIDPESHAPRATFIKQINGCWKDKRSSKIYTQNKLLSHIVKRIKSLHGKKVPKSSYWQYSSMCLCCKRIPYTDIEKSRTGAVDFFEAELRRLFKYVSIISSKSDKQK